MNAKRFRSIREVEREFFPVLYAERVERERDLSLAERIAAETLARLRRSSWGEA